MHLIVNIDFPPKPFTRDEDPYSLMKTLINQGHISIINIYTPNIIASTYLKQILTKLKGEIASNATVVGDFNIPLSTLDRFLIQKIRIQHT